MPIPLKFAMRLLAVLTLVAVVQLSLMPVRSGVTPYMSALSDLTASSAYAAGGCSFRTCLFHGERQSCGSTTISEKCAQKGTNCTSTPC
jgi:hypothetical protein